MRYPLPLFERQASTGLEAVHVHRHCPLEWDQLHAEAQSTFCTVCQKPVYFLSTMNRDAAEKLISCSTNLCVQMERDVTGRVITLDYARPTRPKGHQWWSIGGLMTLMVI